MARYDKYAPRSGGFRAPIGFTPVAGDLNKIFGVGLDVNGRVVKGTGTTGIIGVMVIDKVKVIGDIIDVMTHGEIVEASLSDGTTAIAAGIPVWATSAGLLAVATAVGSRRVGFTAEGGSIPNTRLIVRINPQAAE